MAVDTSLQSTQTPVAIVKSLTVLNQEVSQTIDDNELNEAMEVDGNLTIVGQVKSSFEPTQIVGNLYTNNVIIADPFLPPEIPPNPADILGAIKFFACIEALDDSYSTQLLQAYYDAFYELVEYCNQEELWKMEETLTLPIPKGFIRLACEYAGFLFLVKGKYGTDQTLGTYKYTYNKDFPKRLYERARRYRRIKGYAPTLGYNPIYT